MALKANDYVKAVSETIICNSPGRRHRAFPTGVRLPNGDVLMGFRVGRDHWATHDDAFYTTRSTDNGRTWNTPRAIASFPGWTVNGVIGQYPDGVMPSEESRLRAVLQLYGWNREMPKDRTWRENPVYWIFSDDGGDTWSERVKVHDTIQEVETERGREKFWGLWLHSNESTLHRLSDGRLMGLFVGRRDLMCYNPDSTYPKNSDVALAGFSCDDGFTWTFRTVADNSQGGIGWSESDSVRLPSGRFVAIYGNNAGSPWFYETHSDDEGQTWSPMRQLNFQGNSPSMIQLTNGSLLAAIRSLPPKGEGTLGIGLVASPDGGESWEFLGNVQDQTNWDMGYPDLIKLADGRILCAYYTGSEHRAITPEEEERLRLVEPIRSISVMSGGTWRPAAYGEIQSEIRGVLLEEMGASFVETPAFVSEKKAGRTTAHESAGMKPDL